MTLGRCSSRLRAALFGLIVTAAVLSFGGSAMGSQGHVFDPRLSLEGECNGEDGLVDPGCPYPPSGEPQPLAAPCGVATDPHGDIYVSSPANGASNGRIDVFDPQGQFLAEIDNEREPCKVAVDSRGNLYVIENKGRDFFGSRSITRYEPAVYPPEQGTGYAVGAEIEFIKENGSQGCAKDPLSVAIDPSNDHLYVGHACGVEEFGAVSEGTPDNPLIDCCIGEAPGQFSLRAIDVSGSDHTVYATRTASDAEDRPAAVFVFDGSSGELQCELEGTDTPSGEFDFGVAGAIAIDQANGDLYVADIKNGVVDRFAKGGGDCPQFAEEDPDLGELPFPPKIAEENVDISVDNRCRSGATLGNPCSVSENYTSPNPGHVFITIGNLANNSHLYAFAPRVEGPPEIRSQVAGEIGETEAVLRAELNPHGLATEYHFEYTTQADFDLEGYVGATRVPVPDAGGGNGGAFVSVVEPVDGLIPGVSYRFRLVASNAECTTTGEGVVETIHPPCGEGADASFATYASPPSPSSACFNASLRTGASAALPDCRAYELVSPSDTNGRIATMAMLGEGFGGIGFDTRLASPDGDSLVFGTLSGSLPGIGGGGNQDTYEARRDPGAGWLTAFTGITGAQARKPHPGGVSSDHLYSFWNVEGGEGTLANPVPAPAGGEANYLRVPPNTPHSPHCTTEAEPEGRFEWLACGSLDFEPKASGNGITPDGRIIFTTDTNHGGPAPELEPCAPATGIVAIYERTPGGGTDCVSLLPGNVTPGSNAAFRGLSTDGSVVAFSVGSVLYARVDGNKTFEIADSSPVFAGLSGASSRVFYLEGGNIFACAFDTGGCAGEGAHAPIAVGAGGESTLVNVSEDGSHAYFISKALLSGEEENGQGAKAKAGEQNLYMWDGSAVRFVATVSTNDVSGEGGFGGLGLWVASASGTSPTNGPANDPSRTNPTGTVLVFESRANLTGYAAGGHKEIYRYDSQVGASGQLICLSCNPTQAAAESDARLQSKPSASIAQPFPPVNSLSHIDSLADDGKTVFFQSADRLVAADHDGKVDVYEWEADGMGGCQQSAGCISLISSGQSTNDEFLYGMTPDGHDVFFLSPDTLLAKDPDGTPSLYDARVGGGFADDTPELSTCLGEACQPAVSPPEDPTPASSSFEGPAQKVKSRCSGSKHRGRASVKARCKKSSHKRGTHHRHRRGAGR